MKTLIACCAFAAALLFQADATVRSARCGFCTWDGECFNSSICGSGCVCAKRGLDLEGYCVSFDALPQYEAAGWSEVL